MSYMRGRKLNFHEAIVEFLVHSDVYPFGRIKR